MAPNRLIILRGQTMSLLRTPTYVAAGVVAVWLAALCPVRANEGPAETAAEKARKALAQPRDLEINDQPLDAAVNWLREQTGINFVIDQAAVPPHGFIAAPQGAAAGQVGVSYFYLRLTIHATGRPVRDVLPAVLQRHDLTYAIVADTVYITTPDRAAERQLRQPVRLAVDAVPLKDVLQRLARQTAANIVTDPRQAKAAATAVTADFEDVPLEAAVQVLADQADLEVARVGNVLYVTGAGRAAKLRKQAAPPGAPAGWRVYPDGQGGFRLAPPAGLGGAIGLVGMGGIAGVGPGAPGGAGLGGLGGALGLGGGMVGIGSGVAPPVPLTPPLPGKPAAKPKAPPSEKPDPSKPKAGGQPPAKPGAAPAGKDAPPPPDKKPEPAAKPSGTTPKGRRRMRHLRVCGKRQDFGGG
jgi:hypothetical protein